MLSSSERMGIFFDVLERLAPEAAKHFPFVQTGQPETNDTTLYTLLNRLGALPGFSAVLGVCEDGLPLLIDLADPSPGSILVIGDENSGKVQLLHAILASASILNPVERLVFHVITPDPGAFESLLSFPNCQAVLSAYERDASELVFQLSALAEQRRTGRNQDGVELLVIHDLPEFVQHNDYEANAYLRWLVSSGPDAMVWTLASVRTSQTWRIGDEFLDTFGTQLVGLTSSVQLNSGYPISSRPLQLPGVFTAQLADEMVRFWVPQS